MTRDSSRFQREHAVGIGWHHSKTITVWLWFVKGNVTHAMIKSIHQASVIG
jgi:hypothetical protein